jgi:small-conductance mechanosensitive channel
MWDVEEATKVLLVFFIVLTVVVIIIIIIIIIIIVVVVVILCWCYDYFSQESKIFLNTGGKDKYSDKWVCPGALQRLLPTLKAQSFLFFVALLFIKPQNQVQDRGETREAT